MRGKKLSQPGNPCKLEMENVFMVKKSGSVHTKNPPILCRLPCKPLQNTPQMIWESHWVIVEGRALNKQNPVYEDQVREHLVWGLKATKVNVNREGTTSRPLCPLSPPVCLMYTPCLKRFSGPIFACLRAAMLSLAW